MRHCRMGNRSVCRSESDIERARLSNHKTNELSFGRSFSTSAMGGKAVINHYMEFEDELKSDGS